MSFAILGMGTAVPPHRYSQEEAVAILRPVVCRDAIDADALTALFEHTGIQQRHLAYAPTVLDWQRRGADVRQEGATAERMRFYEREALPLARAAAGPALAESGI